jgi:phosphate transport system substrate-binding protein
VLDKTIVGTSLAMALIVAVGCSKPVVQIDGSSTVYPITEAAAAAFRKQQPDVRVAVAFSGTGGGMKRFIVGDIDICDASRPIKDNEKSECQANGVEYLEIEVAYDGLSVLVNPQNDWCDSLTVDQLKMIWQPDSAIQKWSDLKPEWPNAPIKLYGAGTDSGTFEYFTEAIVGTAKKSRPDYTQSEDDNVLVTGIQGDKYALGYFGYAYYEENKDKLKLLGIDPGDGKPVKPSTETVRDLSYTPLSRPLFIYVNKASLRRPELQAFVKYYVANAGALAEKARFVASPEKSQARNQQRLDEALSALKPAA